MTVVDNLSEDEIRKFDALSYIYSTTYSGSNLTAIVERWGNLQKTTTFSYSGSNLTASTTTWERL